MFLRVSTIVSFAALLISNVSNAQSPSENAAEDLDKSSVIRSQSARSESDEAVPRVQILARVVRFVPNGLSIDFEDGAYSSDVSVLRAFYPQNYYDLEFIIQQPSELPDDSPWKSEGDVLWLAVDEVVLSDSRVAYLPFRVEILEHVE